MDNLQNTLNKQHHDTFDFSSNLSHQSLEDENYLNEIFQQLSQLPRYQLNNIDFSLGQETLESFGGNAIYVDKTAQILKAMQQGRAFLARPRRMGKTLTVSTIQLMLAELYQQSIYPNHILSNQLKDTSFAQQYSANQLRSNDFFGCPYTVLLTLKNVKINAELRSKALQDRNLAQLRELQEQQRDLGTHKNHIEQEFSDSFKYQKLCNLLEQKLLDNPDHQIYDQINLICDELTPQIDLNRVQVLKFLFELKKDTDRSNQDPLAKLKEKQTEIESRQFQLLDQLNSLDTQLKELDVKLNSQATMISNQSKQIDVINSKLQEQVNAVEVNSNQLISATVQEFDPQEYEALGQFRRTLLISLCTSMLFSIDNNNKILTKLKAEILTYAPEYQQGLNCIEDHWQQTLQRQELLEQMLKEIEEAPDFNTFCFSLSIKKLVNIFDSGLSLLIDEYDSPLIDQLDISNLAEYVRQVMEEFFVTFKDADIAKYINVIFVTGMTDYKKASLFHKENNIYDISYQLGFNNIVGLTEHEIILNFAPIICKHAILNNCKPREVINNLLLHNDVYHFTNPNFDIVTPPIFNTKAVLKALSATPITGDNN